MGLFLPGEVWGKQGVIGRIHLCMLTVAWVNITSYLGVSSPHVNTFLWVSFCRECRMRFLRLISYSSIGGLATSICNIHL
jgi:hypothetical protein